MSALATSSSGSLSGHHLRSVAQREGLVAALALVADLADDRGVARDHAALSRQTYLSLSEFAAFFSFPSDDAARMWLRRHADQVPTIHQGRRVLIMRRDAEAALQRGEESR